MSSTSSGAVVADFHGQKCHPDISLVMGVTRPGLVLGVNKHSSSVDLFIVITEKLSNGR